MSCPKAIEEMTKRVIQRVMGNIIKRTRSLRIIGSDVSLDKLLEKTMQKEKSREAYGRLMTMTKNEAIVSYKL